MKYAIEQRMRFIDFTLYHYGEVGRSILVDFFGISKPQATNDLKNYIKLAPDNVRYNTSLKKYIRNPEFERMYP